MHLWIPGYPTILQTNNTAGFLCLMSASEGVGGDVRDGGCQRARMMHVCTCGWWWRGIGVRCVRVFGGGGGNEWVGGS